jgi:hypothetical protein
MTLISSDRLEPKDFPSNRRTGKSRSRPPSFIVRHPAYAARSLYSSDLITPSSDFSLLELSIFLSLYPRLNPAIDTYKHLTIDFTLY